MFIWPYKAVGVRDARCLSFLDPRGANEFDSRPPPLPGKTYSTTPAVPIQVGPSWAGIGTGCGTGDRASLAGEAVKAEKARSAWLPRWGG